MYQALSPKISYARHVGYDLQGFFGERLQSNIDNWLLAAPKANPGMLEMFRDRERRPDRGLVPWAGEFVGKHILAGTGNLRATGDTRLQAFLQELVRDYVATQDADGYLGPFPRGQRLIGRTRNEKGEEHQVWDLWGHYQAIQGLLLWYEHTGDYIAYHSCIQAADNICRHFLDHSRRILEAGAEEMNMSVLHAFTQLYQRTGQARYLSMAELIMKDFETPPAGDYVRAPLSGLDFYQTPKPRWESLHCIQGMGDMYYITGRDDYRRAFEHIWWSIVRHDRHNTGGFSSDEKATGNPYDPAPIETCCTVAWIALSIDMLRMTGLSIVADEIELSTFNAILGAQSPSGRWWTYNTPMNGVRKSSAHDIVFQAREGTPELNCCSVYGPRALGLICDWAVMQCADGLLLNYYGPCKFDIAIPNGEMMFIRQETSYPCDGLVKIHITPSAQIKAVLYLRIPSWSSNTEVIINDQQLIKPEPGKYLKIYRMWQPGDVITIKLDMSLHYWPGKRDCEGLTSIYRGPILLTYDRRFNAFDPEEVPMVAAVEHPQSVSMAPTYWPQPWLRVTLPGQDGREIVLCDFASAGACGTPYRTWLPVSALPEKVYPRESPFGAEKLARSLPD